MSIYCIQGLEVVQANLATYKRQKEVEIFDCPAHDIFSMHT